MSPATAEADKPAEAGHSRFSGGMTVNRGIELSLTVARGMTRGTRRLSRASASLAVVDPVRGQRSQLLPQLWIDPLKILIGTLRSRAFLGYSLDPVHLQGPAQLVDPHQCGNLRHLHLPTFE